MESPAAGKGEDRPDDRAAGIFDGFQGFVARLGGMMRAMGQGARTDYDWSADLVAAIHAELEQHVPVAEIPARQAWRDRRILATRRLQKGD